MNYFVVINADAPSAPMHASVTTHFQKRKAPDGTELAPNPVLECQMIDTSHSSLLYGRGAPDAEGKISAAWIPYGHVLAIIEKVSEDPALGFVHSGRPTSLDFPPKP